MANQYTIQKGDTLSGIAQANKTDVNTLLSLNKSITDPNKIYAGATLNLPEVATSNVNQNVQNAGTAGGQITPIENAGAQLPENSNFSMDLPTEITSQDFSSAFTNPITNQDLQDLLAEQKSYREQLLGTYEKSEAEKALETELADIRAEASALKQGVKEYELDLPKEGISTRGIEGRSLSMEREANISLHRMALQEENLLTRLGMEQEAQQRKQQALTTALGFVTEDMGTVFKMQEAIRQEREDYYNRVKDLRTEQQTTLSTILSQLKGLDFGDLDVDTRAKVEKLATSLGIPVSAIEQGLKVTKDQYALDKLEKETQIYKNQQTANLDAKIKALQVQKLEQEVSGTTPEDIKKSTEAVQKKEAEISTLKEKSSLITDIKDNVYGLKERVGTNIYSRIPTGFWGTLAKGVTTLGMGTIRDAATEISGKGQNFAGKVHQLTSQEFVNNLINAKQQGATFGALTDKEGDALRSAATAINDWEIKDKNGKGIGVWNIDQENFLKEVNRIEDLVKKALERAGYMSEDEYLNNVDNILNQSFNPYEQAGYITK